MTPWWFGAPDNGVLPGVKYSARELQSFLALTQSDFDRYADCFLKDRRVDRYGQPKRSGRGWNTIHGGWSDELVIRHLAGMQVIGLFWRYEVSTLMLDFDNHGPNAPGPPIDLVRMVIWSLPGEWIVYQSSASLGLRAVAFLNRPIPLYVAQRWLKARLKDIGLHHFPGRVEARMDRKPDRLPFGRESMCYDLSALEPVPLISLAETIEYVYDIKQTGYIDADNILADYPNRAGANFSSEWRSRVPRLLKFGLHPDTSTNRALLDLNFYCQGDMHMSLDQARDFLGGWVLKKHNGCSDRMNQGYVDDIRAQIERIIHGFDPAKFGKRSPLAIVDRSGAQLTESELDRLLSTDIANYKDMRAAFSLLKHCKGVCLTTSKKNVTYAPHFSASQHQGYYAPPNSKVTPIPLPVEFLSSLPGFRQSDPGAMMKRLCRLGLFRQTRRAHPPSGHSCEFLPLFHFDEVGTQIESLEAGIRRLMTDKEIRRRFGPHYAKQILDRSEGKRPATTSVLGE